jgi:hypothetical protein
LPEKGQKVQKVQHGNGDVIDSESFFGGERYRGSITIGWGGYLSFSWHGNGFRPLHFHQQLQVGARSSLPELYGILFLYVPPLSL